MDDVFAQYYEELLRAQYRVSEAVQQMLPRGTIREDFLRDIVLSRRGSLKGKKGIISKNNTQSGECDLILYDDSAIVTTLGEQIFIEPAYCKLVLEVKSNATGPDIVNTNVNFGTIKIIDPNVQPFCGLFCYNTQITKRTILRRFGFTYDSAMEGWIDDRTLPLIYPNIDFVICIASLTESDDCIDILLPIN